MREEGEIDLVKGRVQLQLQCPGSPTDGASAEAGDYCMFSAAVPYWLSSQAAHPPPTPCATAVLLPASTFYIWMNRVFISLNQTWQEDAA